MWDRVFDQNNGIWIAMGKIFDLFILNTLLLICSIPIITIGPALTGFFYALINMAREEEESVTKEFFRSFTRNFKQAVLLGLPLTLIIAFLALDVWMCRQAGSGIFAFFMVFFAVVLVMVLFVTVYAFPILAKFEKRNSEILIWAFQLSLKYFFVTLTMFILGAAGWFITRFFPGLIFIIFGLEGMYVASCMAKILKPWLPGVHEVRENELSHILTEEEIQDPLWEMNRMNHSMPEESRKREDRG